MGDTPVPNADCDAARNPKGGKAHRKHGRWETTVCRPDSLSGYNLFHRLTETVPVEQVAPEDRCLICWPTSPTTPVRGSTESVGPPR